MKLDTALVKGPVTIREILVQKNKILMHYLKTSLIHLIYVAF